MKNGNRLSLLFKDLSTASLSLEQSLNIDLSQFSEIEVDVIKNGQIKNLNIALNCCGRHLKNILR